MNAKKLKCGDILFPIVRTNNVTGQLALPLWGDQPCILIKKEQYVSDDPNDCQSDGIEDWRWVVLHAGDILWMSETLLGQFFEYR